MSEHEQISPSLISFSDSETAPPPPAAPIQQQAPPFLGRQRALSLLDDNDSDPQPQSFSIITPDEEQPAFLPRRTSLEASRMRSSAILAGSGSRSDAAGPSKGMTKAEQEEVEKKLKKQSMELNDDDSEVYIPGLMSPNLFHPLPTTDALEPLLQKYLQPSDRPPRDLTGSNPHRLPLEALIQSRQWHSIAVYCQTSILSSTPELTSFLLQHWTLRFHALLRLRLISHLVTELSALFSLLPPSSFHHFPVTSPSPSSSSTATPTATTDTTSEPPAPVFSPVVPFELHVFVGVLPALRGERERSVEILGDIIRACKSEMWKANKDGLDKEGLKWRKRAECVGNLLAGVLMELKAFPSVNSLYSSSSTPTISSSVLNSLCKLHSTTGDLLSLSKNSSQLLNLPNDRVSRKILALETVAKGEWEKAQTEWEALVEEDPNDAQAQNNLAVVLLFSCQLSPAITILENVISTSTITAASDTALFNLATLLELRTEAAIPAKVHLLRDVILTAHGAEEVKASSLKLAL